MANKFVESHQVVQVMAPIALDAGATTGDRVNMANYGKCVIHVLTAVGTAGDDVIITLQEHTAATGGTSANLVIIDEYWHKTGATPLSAVGTFTRATQTAAATIDTATTDGAENEQLIIFEVDAEQLSDGYDFLSINLDDPGTNAQIGAAWYVLMDPRYPQATLVSAIA